MIEKTRVGVLIGRFQAPNLTEGHLALINYVQSRHAKVLILIGRCKDVLVTRKDPLDFYTRRAMIQNKYPDILVLPILDHPSDEEWSKNVDTQIASVFDVEDATLYGSRDSFIPHYTGKCPTFALEESKSLSGTEVREMVSDETRASEDFRRGVIYAAFNSHPIVFPTVDIAVIKEEGGYIALGRKLTDPPGKLRFPGGFVGTQDKSMELTAYREAKEELNNIEISNLTYVASVKINDWRYKNQPDRSLMTTLFIAKYIFGQIKGTDDLDEAGWYPLTAETKLKLLPQHQILFDKVLQHLNKNGTEKEAIREASSDSTSN